MSALNKICDGILAQAKVMADEILDEAQEKAAEILQTCEVERTERKRQLDEAAEQECREIISQVQSTDRQSRRLALLAVKNQVIDEVIAEAKKKLSENPDQELFQSVWHGNILLNNSIDAIFEEENQTLREKAFKVLAAGNPR